MKENRISIQEAAEMMGVTLTFLREGIARGKFSFGISMKLKYKGKRRPWSCTCRECNGKK